MSGLEFCLIEKLVILRRPVDGLMVDLKVSEELLKARILRLGFGRGVDGDAKFGELFDQGSLFSFWQGHGLVGRRNRPDGCRDVILRAIGQNRNGKKRKKQEGAHVGYKNKMTCGQAFPGCHRSRLRPSPTTSVPCKNLA